MFFFGMKKTLCLIWTEKIWCLENILCVKNSTNDLLLFTQLMKNIHPHYTALRSNVYVYVRIRHERSAFQSVSVQAVDWHNDSGPLFSLFFSPLFFFIEGVLGSKNLLKAKVDGSAQKPRGTPLSRPRRPFWDPWQPFWIFVMQNMKAKSH